VGFQVEPTGLRPRHTRLGIAAAVLIGAALIGLGIAAKTTGPGQAVPSIAAAGPTAAASAVAGRSPRPSGTATPPISARPFPTTLDCRDVTPAVCSEATSAALGVLPGDLPEVSGATVWKSLVCSVLPDCPPQLLAGDTVPLGIVILTFTDAGPAAWINVVGHPGTSTGSAALPATAWIVRWQ
jgi:hypothetical protein